jgi:uncharacterized membrane protein YeaQ/YmgE (transglycosylase-associated protein family)
MAARKRSKKSYGFSGAPTRSKKGFDAKRITVQRSTKEVLMPILIGIVGAAIGNGLPKGKNLIGAAAVGLTALALNETRLIPAAIGMAAVIPSTTAPINGIDGLEGYMDHVKLVGTGAKSYLKEMLQGVGAEKLAASLGDIDGWDGYDDVDLEGLDDYDQDTYAALNGMSGTPFNTISTTQFRTPEAIMASKY